MLITVAEAAAFLDADASDTTLIRLTATADAFVKGWCGRAFERTVGNVETLQGWGTDTVFLRESPVETITEVRIDWAGVFGADTIQSDLTQFVADAHRLVYLNGRFPEGRRVVKVTTTAGYATADIPQDLRAVTLEIVAEMFRRGPAEKLASEKAGTRFMSVLAPSQAVVLNRYKRWI